MLQKSFSEIPLGSLRLTPIDEQNLSGAVGGSTAATGEPTTTTTTTTSTPPPVVAPAADNGGGDAEDSGGADGMFSSPSVLIILTAFGIVGILAGLTIVFPENALKVETIVTAVIAGLFGFIAGRKR